MRSTGGLADDFADEITIFTPEWITYISAADLAGQQVRLYFEGNQMCADGTGISKQCTAYNTNEDLWRIGSTENPAGLAPVLRCALVRLLRPTPESYPGCWGRRWW